MDIAAVINFFFLATALTIEFVEQNILNSLMLNFLPWSSLHTAVLANALEAGNLNKNFTSWKLTSLCVAIVTDRIVVFSFIQIQSLVCCYAKLRTSSAPSLKDEIVHFYSLRVFWLNDRFKFSLKHGPWRDQRHTSSLQHQVNDKSQEIDQDNRLVIDHM